MTNPFQKMHDENMKIQMSSTYGKFGSDNDIKEFMEKVEKSKKILNERFGKQSVDKETTYYDLVYNSALDDVLAKLKIEVEKHHKYRIEGFKVGMCHSRTLIEGMKRE